MALSVGTRLGPYEILGTLGAGGMGEVYRARDPRLGREVAVKVLPPSFLTDPERLRRFEQEARATGQLNHPNILAVYDTGTHEGAPYVVAELLEGETLRSRLDGGMLPVRKALDYARQIAHGLAAAHQKGIVHRDLKPENLFITTDGRLKILDFGLAKLTRPDDADGGPLASREGGAGGSGAGMTAAPTQTGTGAGVVLGTVGYMSPEQVRGHPADQRSDIFSFGSILYEMLSGRRAFSAASSVETLHAILKEEPQEIAGPGHDLPPGLERIVQHCLEKGPDERFQSARDLAFHLEALSSVSGAASGPRAIAGGGVAPDLGRAVRAAARRPARMLAALAVLGIALVAAFYAGRLARPPETEADYRQLTFRQGSIFSARFSPGADTVIYSAAWDGRPTELFSTTGGSPESRSLDLPSAAILAVSSTGEMALLMDPHFTNGWMRSGTLARVPLAGGVPREVMRDVEDADWGPDGQTLAVARSVAGRYRLEYPAGKVLYETAQWLSSPRVSRDGRRVAFIDHPAPGDNRGRVALVDLTGALKILTEPFASCDGLAWSPTGGEIWFTAGRTGMVRALYAVDPGGRLRTVDGAPADMGVADVSASGRVLVIRDDAHRGIVGTRPGDPAERDLSWFDWSVPGALSADGEWLLLDEQGQGGGPKYSVYLRKTDGSPAVRLGDGNASSLSFDGRSAAVTYVDEPDRIDLIPRGAGETRTLRLPGFLVSWAGFFPGDDRLLLAANEAGRLVRFYVVAASGGTPKPITPEGTDYVAALSPDGRLLAASVAGAPAQLFPVDGGAPRPVRGSSPGDGPSAWGTDGRSVFVVRRDPPGARLDRLDLGTGARSAVKTLMPADRAGLIDVGFVLVAPDARSYAYSYRRVLSTLYQVDGLR